jgi:ABC-type nitrate/sulfonate/bicarbonate transport system substrate-binding protein
MRQFRWLGLALAASLFSSPVWAGEPAPTKVRFGILTTGSQAAFIVGVKQGIFAKHGFDVDVLTLATGAQANQALAANQVDWSGGGIESTVVAWATGLSFKAYAMYAKGGDSYGILVRNDANIHSPADLAGKKVAVPQGTAPAQGLSQVMKHAGLAPDAVKRVNATFGNMGQMLVQGSVDAMVGLEPYLTLTDEVMAGKATLLMRLGKEVQGGGFFLITDGWAKAHPDKIEDATRPRSLPST